MQISIRKTKVMVVTKEINKQVNILINNQKLEQVAHFKYLGSCSTQDGRSSMEIRKRIAMGREAFNGKKILLTKGLELHLKKRIVKAVVWSVVLYGCESWTLRKMEKKARSF